MAAGCTSAQFWDSLLQTCVPCKHICKAQPVVGRCNKFCVINQCHEQPGHYYDGLLKRCTPCVEVCKGQVAACPQQCLKTTPAAVRTLTKPVQTLPPAGPSAHSTLDSSVLLYSLLAFSVVFVLFSLGLALRVFLREPKARSAQAGPKACGHEDIVNKDLPLEELQRDSSSSDTPTPTETCACVHCFPDVKGPVQDSPIRATRLTREAGLQRILNGGGGGDEWAERDIYTSGTYTAEPKSRWT